MYIPINYSYIIKALYSQLHIYPSGILGNYSFNYPAETAVADIRQFINRSFSVKIRICEYIEVSKMNIQTTIVNYISNYTLFDLPI